MTQLGFPRHILHVDQFSRTDLDRLFAHARAMRGLVGRPGDERLRGRILATLFFEPSTRTRLSFESAMLRLGGQVISAESADITSSAVKGETIEDTVRIVESYADAIVIRHPKSGIPDAAAAVASVPILNAGDGPGEHPTQALLDLFTIAEEIGRVDDLTITLAGDLRYGRAPRSLAMLLTRTKDCRLMLSTPPGIEMAEDVVRRLTAEGVQFDIEPDLTAAASQSDVVYVTRVQKERFPSEEAYQQARGSYHFTPAHLAAMKPDSIVMHPLPRVDEIAAEVDSDRRAAYFRQARYGVYIRMAILDILLGSGDGTKV
ncbi:MAG TPA: aspartate carbamoyltransferase [Thermomicrobiales bacterium]|nr:aspartate carbamoyltransferase [Thermomicrobiales bacterium]